MTDLSRASRFMAWALRHQPVDAGIVLDAHGWTSVAALLHSLQRHGHKVDRDSLVSIVVNDPKGRYAISPDGRMIRANYAHSVEIDFNTPPSQPPGLLFHGTARDFLTEIKRDGLIRKARRFVHLTSDTANAFATGRRHGPSVVIPVDSETMHADGYLFYRGATIIWLTESVPIQYLRFDALMFQE